MITLIKFYLLNNFLVVFVGNLLHTINNKNKEKPIWVSENFYKSMKYKNKEKPLLIYLGVWFIFVWFALIEFLNKDGSFFLLIAIAVSLVLINSLMWQFSYNLKFYEKDIHFCLGNYSFKSVNYKKDIYQVCRTKENGSYAVIYYNDPEYGFTSISGKEMGPNISFFRNNDSLFNEKQLNPNLFITFEEANENLKNFEHSKINNNYTPMKVFTIVLIVVALLSLLIINPIVLIILYTYLFKGSINIFGLLLIDFSVNYPRLVIKRLTGLYEDEQKEWLTKYYNESKVLLVNTV